MKGKRKECEGEGCLNDCPLSMSLNGTIIEIKESIIKINKDICWMKKIIDETKSKVEKINGRFWGLLIGIALTLLGITIEMVARIVLGV